jgi:hypothetical protein
VIDAEIVMRSHQVEDVPAGMSFCRIEVNESGKHA